LIGTVLGYTVLHEMLTATGWCGVLLIAVGIGLVGIDPGGD
jgi:drug/metabolite transporter (DMT)-like permease